MKLDKKLVIKVKLDEHEVHAGDLATLISVMEDVSKAIAAGEALDLLEFLGVPVEQRYRIVEDFRKHAEIPARLEELKNGSAEIVITMSSMLLLWSLTTFLGKPISDAWQESRKGQALKNYVMEKFFGGAGKTAKQKLGERPRRKRIIISDIQVQESDYGQVREISVKLKRTDIELIEYDDEMIINEFTKRLR